MGVTAAVRVTVAVVMVLVVMVMFRQRRLRDYAVASLCAFRAACQRALSAFITGNSRPHNQVEPHRGPDETNSQTWPR